MTPSPSRSPSDKELAVEGLRGTAALIVYLSHFLFGFYPRIFDHLYPDIQRNVVEKTALQAFFGHPVFSVFYNGGAAVALFFVLSGYVLTKPYVERGDLASLRSRFVKRYFRLTIPIAAAVATGYLLVRAGLLYHFALHERTHSDWLAGQFVVVPEWTTLVYDAFVGSLFDGAHRYDPPLWTMRIEFLGSLLLFAAHALLPNRRKIVPNTLVVLAIAFGFFVRSDAIYLMGFWTGSLLPHTKHPGRSAWLILAGVLGLVLWAYDGSGTEDYRVASYLLGSALILYAVVHGRFLNRFFSRRPFVLLGKVSFSLYLIHVPVLFSFTYGTYLALVDRVGPSILVPLEFVGTTMLVIALAWLFERFVDQAGIRFAGRMAEEFR